MSDIVLPKEDPSTYERWEFPAFKTAGVGSMMQPTSTVRPKIGSITPNDIVFPTAAELQEIQNQARDEAYQAAYTEGTQRMTTLLASMEQALKQADQTIAQDIINLSLEIARQMVQQTLKTNPEILLNTIREAINSLPHFNQGAHLILHPEDALIVRENMGEQLSHSGWKIFEDVNIIPGGARVETAHSQIDATLESRWKRIVEAIGQDGSWVQE